MLIIVLARIWVEQERRELIDCLLLSLALVQAHQVGIPIELGLHEIEILSAACLAPEELPFHREDLMWDAEHQTRDRLLLLFKLWGKRCSICRTLEFAVM